MWQCASARSRQSWGALSRPFDSTAAGSRQRLMATRALHREELRRPPARVLLDPIAQRRSWHAFAALGDEIRCKNQGRPMIAPSLDAGRIRSAAPLGHAYGHSVHTIPSNLSRWKGPGHLLAFAPQVERFRSLSTRRGFPPRRTLREKMFAGAVVVMLAAWGLLFGAVTLLLLPFVGLAIYLLRRDFTRGGPSRKMASDIARRMSTAGPRFPETGGIGGGGLRHLMQRAPMEGMLSSLLAQMLGGGIRGMQLVGVLRSEVQRRALRHPGLSRALGGDLKSFSDVEMSTVGTAGGFFGPAGGGGERGAGPSRRIKARLRFEGDRPGAAGWAEVEVSDWPEERGNEGAEGLEYDRVVVTLDSGRVFDLTDGVADSGNVRFSHPEGESGRERRGGSRSGVTKDGEPVEATFRDKR